MENDGSGWLSELVKGFSDTLTSGAQKKKQVLLLLGLCSQVSIRVRVFLLPPEGLVGFTLICAS